jgi:hypothetical protein
VIKREKYVGEFDFKDEKFIFETTAHNEAHAKDLMLYELALRVGMSGVIGLRKHFQDKSKFKLTKKEEKNE